MGQEAKEKAQEWLQGLEDPGNRFALGAEIGSGKFSVVHEATTDDGKSVAIKIVEELENQIESIYEEHQVLSEICCENPRFPTFHGTYRNTGVIPHQIWFVMELCEEGSIQSLLLKLKEQERFLKEDIIAYILREVLQGIKILHEQNIIHRDIKASNILVCKDGEIKLCDFGFAKHVESPEGRLKAVVGSPYWIAPEVVASGRNPDIAYDSRADVWSLGITAAELGDCEPPNADVYAPRVLFQILQNPPPTLKRGADWTQLYNDFISECLEKNPDHRPWSAELVEHTFITEIAERENQIRKSLIHVINELRKCPISSPPAEITVKGDMIQMDRKSAPQPMYRDDLATLDSVSDESVMETLNQRFAQGNIYTYLGDILIMINPFREYPIYGAEVASRYKYRARCDNAPHIYAVADRAYQDMLHHKEVQNIILTGETGSGKTSSGKHLLWHLANMTASNKKMVERILKVSTVMEAFGNAATVFNTNSTRHAQYLELTFTKTGKLSGGILWAYCLEKWRVTSCARSQSNFHIFYYLMDTLCSTDQASKYHLEKGRNYNYLPSSPAHTPAVNVDKLREVKEAFHVLDFSLDDQESIVQLLSAILLVGQIQFKGEEEAEILNLETVNKIAELLKVDEKKLAWTFTNYCVITGGETVHGKNRLAEAEDARDSLARSLYCRLVDWIVNLINTKLSFTRLVFGDHHSLGILDIPGFECFAHDNTLDQFLVNMTNEQMQFFYNQRVFVWEMQDYEKEELSGISYNYHDNRELLDAVLSKPNGLLAFLDEETKSAGNDHKNFIDQTDSKLQTRFIRATDTSTFTVSHYSGQVIYDARNFVERNKNFTSPEMIQVMRLSENPAVVQLFSNLMTKTGNLTISEEDMQGKQTKWTSALAVKPQQAKKFNTKSRGKYSQSRQMQTIAATMRNSLLELLQKVSEGSAHFVRCLRSNLKSTPFSFDRDLIRYQIRALGIVETIRARQLGHPRRLKFAEFLRRYKFLAFDFDENVDETRDNCRLLLIRLKLEGWNLGKSRVLLKHYNEEFLSRLYENQVHKVIKIQSMMRAFLARKKMNKKFPRLAEIRQGSIQRGLSQQSSVCSN
ncbi:unnamed protein product [Orchesella dallaii]|uniref:Neither inactivation nor afterpotential protein C n=1 Tax=Orchesella dallaii TaxID=48710 RepID=A0ABP1QAZ4_9HEXA